MVWRWGIARANPCRANSDTGLSLSLSSPHLFAFPVGLCSIHSLCLSCSERDLPPLLWTFLCIFFFRSGRNG